MTSQVNRAFGLEFLEVVPDVEIPATFGATGGSCSFTTGWMCAMNSPPDTDPSYSDCGCDDGCGFSVE